MSTHSDAITLTLISAPWHIYSSVLPAALGDVTEVQIRRERVVIQSASGIPMIVPVQNVLMAADEAFYAAYTGAHTGARTEPDYTNGSVGSVQPKNPSPLSPPEML